MKKQFLSYILILSLILVNVPFVKADEAKIEVYNNKETFFEAEIETAEINDPYIIKEDSNASNGKYVYLKPDAPYTPKADNAKKGELIYNIDVKETGYYFLWQKVYATDNDSRTSYFAIDDGIWSYLGYEANSEWTWYMMSTVYFEKGMHTLRITYRQPRVKYDQFVITSSPDYNPGGERLAKPEFLPNFQENMDLYYNLPPITPPKEHPRVFFTKNDLPRLRENIKYPDNKVAYDQVIKLSELPGDGKLPKLTPEANTNVNENLLACAEANAFLYQLNNDKEKGLRAKELALNMITTMVNRPGGDALTRSGGYCLFIISEVYDWCYDLFTPEELEIIRQYTFFHASTMEIGWPSIKQGNVTGHALEGQLWRDLFGPAIAFYDEDPKMYNLIAGRMFDQMIPSKNYLYGSTFFNEGSFYGPYRYYFEMIATHLFSGMGYKNIFSKKQEYALYGMLYGKRPDGRNLVRGDDSAEDLNGFDGYYGSMCFLAGNYYKNPYLKREFYRCNKYGQQYSVSNLGIGATLFLIVNDPNVNADKSFHDFPLTTFSGTPMGLMNARTSWDDGMNSDSVIVQMNVNEKFLSSHQHLDFGNFTIYYKGGLAIDSGMYESAPFVENGKQVTSLTYGSSHDLNYAKRSIAHNTMLVYDQNEKIKSEYASALKVSNDGGQRGDYAEKYVWNYEDIFTDKADFGKVLAYDFGPDLKKPAYSYLKGNLKNAYTDKVKDYSRSFMFLNLFNEEYPAALIVLDNIETSNKDFKKTWLLHSQEEPDIQENKSIIKRTEFGGNGRLINETLLPENVTINKVGGKGEEFLVENKNYTAVPKTPTTESGNWRIEVSPKNSSKNDIFLNVIQISDNNDEIKPLESKIIKDDEYIGVNIKDRVVLLKKDDKLSSKVVNINMPKSEEKLMFIVNGLKAGKWSVVNENNEVIYTNKVSKGQDTFSFEAPSGNYKLVYSYESINFIKDLSTMSNISEFNNSPFDIKIDSMFETFSNKVVVKNDILMLPLEEFLNKSGIKYEINDDLIKIKGKREVELAVSSDEGKSNNQPFKLESKVEKINNLIYAPMTKLCEQLKIEIAWDKQRNIAFFNVGNNILLKSQIVNSDDEKRIAINDVFWSSGSNEVGYVSVDNNILSYWSALGDNEWITYEFKDSQTISKLEAKWHLGNERVQNFDVFVSNDNEKFEKVYSGKSDGKTNGFETVNLNIKEKYKYLKIVGHGNSANSWNSISEIRLYK